MMEALVAEHQVPAPLPLTTATLYSSQTYNGGLQMSIWKVSALYMDQYEVSALSKIEHAEKVGAWL
jgi:hypothetical protein